MNTTPKRTLVSFDWAAKKILRDKANFDILEGFLSTLLRQDIKILSILDSEGNQERETDKFNRVDLLVKNQSGELIVVEVQNNREVHYLERLLYGSSKLIVDHMQLGERYEKLKKVISISILYFLLGEGDSDYVYHGCTEFYGFHNRSRLQLKPQQRQALFNKIDVDRNIFPEYYLIQVERFQNIIKSDLDEWIYFFKNSEVKDEFKAKNIQRVKEKLDLMKMSEAERQAYERYLLNKASERGMLESAKLEGREEAKITMAKTMLANNEPIEKIKLYTQLSEQEILTLQSQT